MITKTIFINKDNQFLIKCIQCGKIRSIASSQIAYTTNPMKVKCACGFSFMVIFERRVHYRKQVCLCGEYVKTSPDKEMGEVTIENISKSGLKFRTERKRNSLMVGDIIRITFTLDDSNKSVISRLIEIKHVNGQIVGAQFCDTDSDKVLGFYLMI